jgi:hypothetical protein
LNKNNRRETEDLAERLEFFIEYGSILTRAYVAQPASDCTEPWSGNEMFTSFVQVLPTHKSFWPVRQKLRR